LQFYHELAPELARLRPLGKFISVKAVVFFSFWCAPRLVTPRFPPATSANGHGRHVPIIAAAIPCASILSFVSIRLACRRGAAGRASSSPG
jgi:hypothetical protein